MLVRASRAMASELAFCGPDGRFDKLRHGHSLDEFLAELDSDSSTRRRHLEPRGAQRAHAVRHVELIEALWRIAREADP
jgi:hypothetical protein